MTSISKLVGCAFACDAVGTSRFLAMDQNVLVASLRYLASCSYVCIRSCFLTRACEGCGAVGWVGGRRTGVVIVPRCGETENTAKMFERLPLEFVIYNVV